MRDVWILCHIPLRLVSRSHLPLNLAGVLKKSTEVVTGKPCSVSPNSCKVLAVIVDDGSASRVVMPLVSPAPSSLGSAMYGGYRARA